MNNPSLYLTLKVADDAAAALQQAHVDFKSGHCLTGERIAALLGQVRTAERPFLPDSRVLIPLSDALQQLWDEVRALKSAVATGEVKWQPTPSRVWVVKDGSHTQAEVRRRDVETLSRQIKGPRHYAIIGLTDSAEWFADIGAAIIVSELREDGFEYRCFHPAKWVLSRVPAA